jgi:hypothetical protein
LTVEPDALDPFAFASHAYPDFHLLMPLYIATRWQGALKLDAERRTRYCLGEAARAARLRHAACRRGAGRLD